MSSSDRQRGNLTYSLYFSLNTLPKDWLKNKRISDNHVQTTGYRGMGNISFKRNLSFNNLPINRLKNKTGKTFLVSSDEDDLRRAKTYSTNELKKFKCM